MGHIHDNASSMLQRVMLAMTLIISDVVSYANAGVSLHFSGFTVAGMHRWQISIQASIP
jgi:hypothetical protein